MENKHEVFLTTKDLDLVLLTQAYAGKLASWFNDQEVTSFLARGEYPMTTASEAEYIEKLYKDDTHFQLGIVHKETDELIGTTGLHRINSRDQTASFGILIGEKDYWGKSYGTQVLEAILSWAFTIRNLRTVTLSVLGNNPRGMRCYEKCGFTEVGRYPKHIFKNGAWHDEILMIAHRDTPE
jgi:RimJ/RimL family protein N-acetyltransferase